MDTQKNVRHQGTVREAARGQDEFGKEKGHSFETENKESKKSKERFLVLVSLIIFIQFSLLCDRFHKY